MKVEQTCPECSAVYLADGRRRFCPSEPCAKQRAKDRWQKWHDGQTHEAYRDKVNNYQRHYRSVTNHRRHVELAKYGLTWDDWVTMVALADGRCEICGDGDAVLCVDHNHATGKVRGVLCRKCNLALGGLGDTSERIRVVLDYLCRTDGDCQ